MKPLIEAIKRNNELQLTEIKDRVGFNLSGLKMLMRVYESSHNAQFFSDELVAEIDSAKKKRKSRKPSTRGPQ